MSDSAEIAEAQALSERLHHRMTVARAKYQRRLRFAIDFLAISSPLRDAKFTADERRDLYTEACKLHDAFTIKPERANDFQAKLVTVPQRAAKLWDTMRQHVSVKEMIEHAQRALESSTRKVRMPVEEDREQTLNIFLTQLVHGLLDEETEAQIYEEITAALAALDFGLPSPMTLKVRYDPGDIEQDTNPCWEVKFVGLAKRAVATALLDKVRALRDAALEKYQCQPSAFPLQFEAYGSCYVMSHAI